MTLCLIVSNVHSLLTFESSTSVCISEITSARSSRLPSLCIGLSLFQLICKSSLQILDASGTHLWMKSPLVIYLALVLPNGK